MVINHRLPGFAVLGAAEKQAAVRAEIVIHFERDLEIAVRFVGNDDSAITGKVLAAHDRAVLHDPLAARSVFAGAAMSSLGADVPAVQRCPVEDRIEPAFGGEQSKSINGHCCSKGK